MDRNRTSVVSFSFCFASLHSVLRITTKRRLLDNNAKRNVEPYRCSIECNVMMNDHILWMYDHINQAKPPFADRSLFAVAASSIADFEL